MNRKLPLIIVSFILLLMLSTAVSAEFIDNAYFESLGEALETEWGWPPWGPSANETTITVGHLLLAWGAIFTIFFILLDLIPLFDKTPHKGALKGLAFSISGIALTGSTFPADFLSLLGLGTGALEIAIIIILVLAGIKFLGWAGGKSGINNIHLPARNTPQPTPQTPNPGPNQRQQQINNLMQRLNALQGRIGNVIGNNQLNQQRKMQEMRAIIAELRQIQQEIARL